MFAKDRFLAAGGTYTKDEAELQYHPATNYPLYRYTCLHCPFYAENIADLKLAEQAAENHAKDYSHRVRLSFDLANIEIEVINGEEPRG